MNDSTYTRGQKIIAFGRLVVKYAPVLAALDMFLHVALLLVGYDVHIADFFFSTSCYGAIVLIAASYAFGYCVIHRCMIVYATAVSFCINFQQSYDFGILLIPLRWLMFLLGVALFVWFAITRIERQPRCYRCCHHNCSICTHHSF